MQKQKTFFKGAVKLLEVLVTKLQEWSPLKSDCKLLFFTFSSNCGQWKKVSNVKFRKSVDSFYGSKSLSLFQADNAKCQYNDLLQSDCILQEVLITSLTELLSF